MVIGIVESADLLRGLDHFVEDLRVLNELREDAEAAFSGLVNQDVGGFGIAKRDNADLVGLHLKDAFDGALQRMLERDDAFRLKAKGCDGLDVERVGHVGGEELDQAEILADIVARAPALTNASRQR